MNTRITLALAVMLLGFGSAPNHVSAQGFTPLEIAQTPLFTGSTVPPHVMLNLSVDSQLFFSAYPEYADLSGDGAPDMGYVHEVDYFGYFDSYKCYRYSASNGRFQPVSETANKYCPGDNWSGNFLNWLTMTRLDAVRQILYGGTRSTDTAALTVLERSYLPNDAHSFVRFYDGDDLNDLSPYTSPAETTTRSPTATAIVSGSRQGSNDRFWIDTPDWTSSDVFNGDQIEMTHPDHPGLWMRGVVIDRNFSGSNREVRVQVTGSANPGNVTDEISNWQVVNPSRRGMSFCNTTVATGASHAQAAINAPPLLRVARGDNALWTANERWQCLWREDVTSNSPPGRMHIGGRAFQNGNDVVASGLWSNADLPRRNDVREDEFIVRVEACVEGLLGEERCQEYGDSIKPIGLLQQFGETGALRFGLMTGSFTNHVSGGVLRKNMGTFADEVDLSNGVFLNPTDSIVRSMDALRVFGYSHNSGVYTAGDEDCNNVTKAAMIGGRCYSWGNPQAEIFAESLRYLAGLAPNTAFTHTGNDRIPGLTSADWENPITEQMWCTPKTIIQFNSSITSFDDGAPSSVAGLPDINDLNTWTNKVGAGEGLHGLQVFSGGSDGFCNPSALGSLSDFRGICPEAPNQDGTYHIAGLAHYAYTTDLRPTWRGEQTVDTIGVSLAPAVPVIRIPRPGQEAIAVEILPACDNDREKTRCALADFRIVEQNLEQGTGRFFVQWDVAEWGADFDSDLNGDISYRIVGNEIEITTNVWADSSAAQTGFGYIISGTNRDGWQVHSGINGYTRNGTGGVEGCNNCRIGDAPSSRTYQIGGGTATLLREPLFYAAKWGGYERNQNFPTNPASWDSNGDGTPDNYFLAADPAELFRSLREAFQRVIDAIETTTLETTSSRLEETGTLVYQAGFDTADWSGDITALDPFAPSGDREQWRASARLEARGWNDRRIVTKIGNNGYEFRPNVLPDETVARVFKGVESLLQGADCNGIDAERWYCNVDSAELIDFIRGDTSNAQSSGGFLRDRSSMIGDIVNSQIVLTPVAARANEGWGRVVDPDNYPAHVESKIKRVEEDKATVFVGSNSGKLHAFNAITGNELFAFIPQGVLDNLYQLADPSYQHRYYVDGRMSVADALIPGRGWRQVLVGSLGAGGRSLFALDVTTPESFNPATDVLWEITPSSSNANGLGHMFGSPVITRLSDGRFVALVGNGFNSNTNRPELMVINLANGDVIQSYPVDLGNNSPANNGLAQPAILLDVQTRSHVTRAYAGDLSGRMYAFEFEGASIDSHREIFRGVIGQGNNAVGQAITSAPNITTSVEGGLNIHFGTGRFFVVGDELSTSPVQSFYRVRDTGGNSSLRRSDLGEAIITGSEGEFRSVSADSFSSNGWRLDLIEGGNSRGERILVRPEIIAGRVIFSTFEPSNDPCEGGGIPRLYVLDAESGGGALSPPGLDLPGAGGVEIPGVGSPLNPPVVIAPPPVAPIDDDGNPFPPDDPDNPFPIPPSGDGLDRSSWCARIGYLSPINQQFQPLAALCDGRQVWRQIW
ncbi:MAG: pilus assembly protein [Wenzhouxiangella sp.]